VTAKYKTYSDTLQSCNILTALRHQPIAGLSDSEILLIHQENQTVRSNQSTAPALAVG